MQSRKRKWIGLAVGCVILLLGMLASVLFGLQQFGLRDIWLAYTQFDGSNEHLIVTTTRVPRALIAAAAAERAWPLPERSCRC